MTRHQNLIEALIVASAFSFWGCSSPSAPDVHADAALPLAGADAAVSAGRDAAAIPEPFDASHSLQDAAIILVDAAVPADAGASIPGDAATAGLDAATPILPDAAAIIPTGMWVGIFPPGGGDDLAGGGHVAKVESDLGVILPVIQTYRSTAEPSLIEPELAEIWAHGSTPHLNLEPGGYSAAQYADAANDPTIDADLHQLATALAQALADNPGGRLLFTFGAEMNGPWTDWGCLAPDTFIAFYRKAHDLVGAALAAEVPPIDSRRLRWVFGPNGVGYCGAGMDSVDYYPGHAYVDYLGMSSYREDTASVATVVSPVAALMDGLGYPDDWRAQRFILLQTGSKDISGDDRGGWIGDLYSTLGSDPSVLGAIWFDQDVWAVLSTSTPPTELNGYSDFIAAQAALAPFDEHLAGTFEPYFWDVRMANDYWAEIQALRAAGITSGCNATPPLFCPNDDLSRGSAAVLLSRAFNIAPDTSTPALFTDVPQGASGFGEIQALARTGALAGCTASTFCPADAIAREDLAWALAVLCGASGSGTPTFFSDLGGLDPTRAEAIDELGRQGDVDGCAIDTFCPKDPATRAVGAAWIVRSVKIAPAPPP